MLSVHKNTLDRITEKRKALLTFELQMSMSCNISLLSRDSHSQRQVYIANQIKCHFYEMMGWLNVLKNNNLTGHKPNDIYTASAIQHSSRSVVQSIFNKRVILLFCLLLEFRLFLVWSLC